jgi:hypothetical protein
VNASPSVLVDNVVVDRQSLNLRPQSGTPALTCYLRGKLPSALW